MAPRTLQEFLSQLRWDHERMCDRLQQIAARQGASHPAWLDQPWQTWRIKNGQKRPLIWKAKHTLLCVKDEDGLPTRRYRLVVCENPPTGEVKYFLSNAPRQTPLKKLLQIAFWRWPIERCFEDQKGELGVTHWGGRGWLSLHRHWMFTSSSYLFLGNCSQPGGVFSEN